MLNGKSIVTVTLNPAIDQTVSIPNFKAGAVNRVVNSRSDAGGKGVNVASVLADYGLSVTATGFLGEENTSLFERLFAQKQIKDHFVRIAGATRTGIKVIDEINQETTDINFPGQAPTEANVAQLLQILEQVAGFNEWFVLAGSIPTGLPQAVYHQLVTMIRQHGRCVALDTSGQGLHQAIEAGPTIVKPNIDELQELVGQQLSGRQQVIDAARQWLGYGIDTVVVSMGADGALFVEANEVIMARPPRIKVKSTVGAGDAMVSGTVAGKIEGYNLAECARLATAFSVSAISRVASQLPAPEVINDLKQQVTIESIN
jgi:1-phosphofructokinase